MADFDQAFKKMLKHEGGYVNDPDDAGGETYRGVARKRNAKWLGWIRIGLLKQQPNFPANLDHDETLQQHIAELYKYNYWDKVRGDDIQDQNIAESIFDFGVNAGPRTSSKLAQMTVGVTADGVIGEQTLTAINNETPKTFLAVFALTKISRYIKICNNRKSNRKFFFGWVRRTLEGV